MVSNSDLIRYFPDVDGDELVTVGNLVKDYSEEEVTNFSIAYNSNRKSPMVTLLLDLFLGTLGIHRFYLGQIGMGVLYIFTLGILGIGVLIDLFRFKTLTIEANAKIANSIAFRVNLSTNKNDTAEKQHQLQSQAQHSTISHTPMTPMFVQREMHIVGIGGAYSGQNITITGSPVIIGRDASSCNIVIGANDVSRRHAKLYADGRDGIIIDDLGSTNGTFVQINGSWAKITSPTRMTIFMRFRVGKSDNEFEVR